MRAKGTKYEKVNEIPNNALQVSVYAEQQGIRNPAYVCVKYDRYLHNKGSYPGYKIVCWNGTNIVIPG
jgi:hypothetical protein